MIKKAFLILIALVGGGWVWAHFPSLHGIIKYVAAPFFIIFGVLVVWGAVKKNL